MFKIDRPLISYATILINNDSAHVALTLELNGLLWTGDKILKEGLLKKGFTQFFDY